MPDSVFDRIRTELDQLGDTVQRGLEQGKLHIDKARIVSQRDGLARELGLLAYQKERGQEADSTRYQALLGRIDKLQEEIARIERAIAATKGETVSVSEDPPPPSEPVENTEEDSAKEQPSR